jgi:molybdopterin-dependent oxidoreductase-like protein
MIRFEYQEASGAASAVTAVASRPDAAFLAGGTNLIDHMKLDRATPGLLVDISALPLDGIEALPDRAVRDRRRGAQQRPGGAPLSGAGGQPGTPDRGRGRCCRDPGAHRATGGLRRRRRARSPDLRA